MISASSTAPQNGLAAAVEKRPGTEADRRWRILERMVMARLTENSNPLKPLMLLSRAVHDPETRLRHFRFLLRVLRSHPMNLAVCAHLLQAAQATGRVGMATNEINRRLAQLGDTQFRWDADNFLYHLAKGRALARPMARLKFGFEQMPDDVSLLDLASRIESRVAIRAAVLDQLYAARTDTLMPREEWERRVRCAFAIDHIVEDRRFLEIDVDRHILSQVDMAAWDRIVADVTASGPVVFVIAHAGQLSVLRILYSRQSDWLTLQAYSGNASNAIPVAKDQRTALFIAYRALQDGKSVMIAADGMWGNATDELSVLGTRSGAGEGAPFLAYEVRRPIVCLNVVRRGDKLVPVASHGPRREDGESYLDFKARFKAFFASEIEGLMTGDPDSIALRARWTGTLAKPPEASPA